MDKKALYNLLGKYLRNACTPEEAKLIEDWLTLLQENEAFTAYTKDDLDTIHNRIWQKIQEDTDIQNKIKKPVAQRSIIAKLSKWVVAATLAGLLLFAGFNLTGSRAPAEQNNFTATVPSSGMVEKVNTGATPLKLILEDSSAVVLEPGTTLNYPTHFLPGKREVYLQGKAFFVVSKNNKRPFFIYHNNLVTHVLGTSFIINTRKKANEAEVSVLSGRVEVSENTALARYQPYQKINGVILTPNQKVVYAADSRVFVPSIVDNPIPVKKKNPENFDFDDVGLARVLSVLSTEYGIEIITENENISKCTFTGNIAKQDLYTKLDIICRATNSSYELKGTKVLIKGAGCD